MIAILTLMLTAGTVELRCPSPEIVVRLSDRKSQSCPYEYVNNSEADVQLWGTRFCNNHKITLKTMSGEPAPLTDMGIAALEAFDGKGRDSNFPVVLKPGQTSRHTTPRLTEYFVLKPGNYEMTIMYSDKSFGLPLQMTSSKIRVRVIQ